MRLSARIVYKTIASNIKSSVLKEVLVDQKDIISIKKELAMPLTCKGRRAH